MNDDQQVLTVEEAAGILRISRAFAYDLVARNELPTSASAAESSSPTPPSSA